MSNRAFPVPERLLGQSPALSHPLQRTRKRGPEVLHVWFKQALCVAAPANVPQQVSIAFSGSRQHSAKHREVHIATGEDQADTFPLHAVALLEQCRQRCGASPLRDIVSVGEQIARAASISSSETVTTRSAPSQIDSSASTMGTRQAMPSAIVSAELVDTGRR